MASQPSSGSKQSRATGQQVGVRFFQGAGNNLIALQYPPGHHVGRHRIPYGELNRGFDRSAITPDMAGNGTSSEKEAVSNRPSASNIGPTSAGGEEIGEGSNSNVLDNTPRPRSDSSDGGIGNAICICGRSLSQPPAPPDSSFNVITGDGRGDHQDDIENWLVIPDLDPEWDESDEEEEEPRPAGKKPGAAAAAAGKTGKTKKVTFALDDEEDDDDDASEYPARGSGFTHMHGQCAVKYGRMFGYESK